jgi:3',5'-cyclic-AMP phosphodiesterase
MEKRKWNLLSIFLVIIAISVLLYRGKDRLMLLKDGMGPSKVEKIDYERNTDEKSDLSMFSFAILGDSRQFIENKGKYLTSAANKIGETNADLAFTVGDMVPECNDDVKCANAFNLWKKYVSPLLPITYGVQGNHDRSGGDKADVIWRSQFDLPLNGPDGYDELVYSFNFGNSHFVVLDTEKPKEHDISEAQLDWLDYDLGVSDSENTFVFFHEPAFPVSSKMGDSIDMSPKDRNRLWSILDSHDVTAVFNGHEHIFSRHLIDNRIFPEAKNKIQQFIIGNTDAPLEDVKGSVQADFTYTGRHYAIVDVEGKNITLNLYTPEGELVHSFSFSKKEE